MHETSGRGRWDRLVVAGVACLLAILLIQLALSVRRASQTWDEGDHIFAGYMSWKRADFGLNPEHPPLVKLLATVPLLTLPLRVPEIQRRNFKIEAFLDGNDFVAWNNPDSLLFRVRMAALPLTMLLALLVFLAAREMFGTGAAFLALALFVFEPNLLAHGAWVTTDAGVSCFMFAAVYAFYRYVKVPSLGRLALVGAAAGLALATKHTGLLVLPMLALAALSEVARDRKTAWREAARLAAALVLVTVLAVAVLWAFYGFRYRARPAGLEMNPPLARFAEGLRPAEARAILTLARWRALPESYLFGLADVRRVEDGSPSYVFGKVYPKGVWFYFPAAFAIKSTLAFLALLLIAAGAIARRRLRAWREILFLTVPPLFYLAVAMASGLNIGVRHILPLYVFFTVLAAGAAGALIVENRRWKYVVAALLVCHVVSSARSFPVYLAYSNELWGGPSSTYKYLTDSNTDWAAAAQIRRAIPGAAGRSELLVRLLRAGRGVHAPLRHPLPAAADHQFDVGERSHRRAPSHRWACAHQRRHALGIRDRSRRPEPLRPVPEAETYRCDRPRHLRVRRPFRDSPGSGPAACARGHAAAGGAGRAGRSGGGAIGGGGVSGLRPGAIPVGSGSDGPEAAR